MGTENDNGKRRDRKNHHRRNWDSKFLSVQSKSQQLFLTRGAVKPGEEDRLRR